MRVAVLVVLVGCTEPQRLLAELREAKVTIDVGSSESQPARFYLHVDVPGCAAFDDRLQAHVNGLELVFTPADGSGDSCIQASAQAVLPPTLDPVLVTMADPSDTWRFALPGPFTALELESPLVAGEESAIAWPGALPLVNGCVRVLDHHQPTPLGCVRELLADVRIDEATNTLRVRPPFPSYAAQLEVQLAAQAELAGTFGHASLPRCEGPASCTFLVKTTQLLDVAIALGRPRG